VNIFDERRIGNKLMPFDERIFCRGELRVEIHTRMNNTPAAVSVSKV
jgi:hypothetical protein